MTELLSIFDFPTELLAVPMVVGDNSRITWSHDVRGRRMLRRWASQRIFQTIHLRNLVYNTCWEDPRLDREAMQLGPDDRIAMITSAGCNALDYLLDEPAEVHCVDMNPRQNALLELKVAAIRTLGNDDVFAMFGRGYLPGVLDVYKTELRNMLSPLACQFWDHRIQWFGNPRRSFFYRGTSGNFARAFNVYLNRVLRVRPWVDALFQTTTLEEQREIFERHLWPRVWKRSVRSIVSRDTTLAMLGVPRPQRIQVEKYCEGGIAGFIESCMRAVFAERPLRDNYFYHAYLKGGYTASCCPEYLVPSNLERLRAGLLDRLQLHTNTMEGFLREHQGQLSRYVLLDHMDWLANVNPAALAAEWQAIIDRAGAGARVLWRSGGPNADFLDGIEVLSKQGRSLLSALLNFDRDTSDRLHPQDRVATYASFHVADLAA